MTADAEPAIALKTVLILVDAGEVIPDSPEMGEAQWPDLTKNVTVGHFRGVIQERGRYFGHGDRSEQHVPAHRGGKVSCLIAANGLDRAPDFTVAWAV